MLQSADPRRGPTAAIRVSDQTVRIVDVVLPRREQPGPWTPALPPLVLDQPTVDLLRFIALGLEDDQNVLLEGETGTSKSSAVTYLAALTNHELVRINLTSQTEAADLIGRFAPNPHRGATLAELMEHLEELSPESQAIVSRAHAEGRPLDRVERHRLAACEGWSSSDEAAWRFAEGPVPQAVRRGAWVLFDELNLAPTELLEVVNSLLEKPRTLFLSQGDGTRFGPGGVPIHPDFRLVAAMNPVESYAGRGVLSPAFLNRWSLAAAVPNPGEAEFRALVMGLVYGEQPSVEVNGQAYHGLQGLRTRPPFVGLAALPEIRQFLEHLAVFHQKLGVMAQPGRGQARALGQQRRQPYVFTRRELLATLDLLARRVARPPEGESAWNLFVAAVNTVYLSRLSDAEDRRKAQDALDALGLVRRETTPERWLALLQSCPRILPEVEWRTVKGHLDGGQERVEYSFFGLAGDAFSASCSVAVGPGRADFQVQLDLLDESGRCPAGLRRPDGAGDSALVATLPADGLYKLGVSGKHGRGRGGEFTLAYCTEPGEGS